MSCLAQLSGDLDLTTGNIVVVTDFDQCLAIKLTNRFQLFIGEWFVDKRIGVPYYQLVYVKNPDLPSIGQLLKRVILQTPGVQQILQANLNFFAKQRQLDAFFKVQSQTGAIIEGGLGKPFIVQPNAKVTS